MTSRARTLSLRPFDRPTRTRRDPFARTSATTRAAWACCRPPTSASATSSAPRREPVSYMGGDVRVVRTVSRAVDSTWQMKRPHTQDALKGVDDVKGGHEAVRRFTARGSRRPKARGDGTGEGEAGP